MRDNIVELLELEHYHVLSAENGRIGVETAIREIPDLVLCDIQMPEMDGFEVFFTLNKTISTAGLPFIFLSARAEMRDQKYGLSLGADDYVTKPFEPDLLLAIISRRLEAYGRQKAETTRQLTTYIQELESMLHTVSHRIRSPLCSCIGLLDMMERSEITDPAKREEQLISYMRKSINEMDDVTRSLTTFLAESRSRKMGNLGRNDAGLPGE